MATVVSLTEAKIKEMLSGWEGVALSQDQINALVGELAVSQESLNLSMDELNNVTIVKLEQDLADNAVRLEDLNGSILPGLSTALDQVNLELENLNSVALPSLRESLDNEIQGTIERPKVFVSPDEPPPYDDLEERDLVVGDTWFDSDDNNKQRIWNGTIWTTFGIDIPDFSVTVKKLQSTRHQIY